MLDRKGLTGNQLKLLAMAAMTLDHVGVSLLPQWAWLRIIGRLAFPIFAFMIAEGCRYTRSKGRYLGLLAAVALVCQAVYFVAMESLYQCVLVTFSLSVILIWLTDNAENRPTAGNITLAALGVILAFFTAEILPELLPETDFSIDYGFCGIMLPVLIYLGKDQKSRLLFAGVGLAVLGLRYGGAQWYGLLALLPLALYSGKRGKAKLKYLFYIYYPAHLAIIYLIGLIL